MLYIFSNMLSSWNVAPSFFFNTIFNSKATPTRQLLMLFSLLQLSKLYKYREEEGV